ncbi:putative cellulose-binding family ii protein [Scedosporium apiospermum]|uniref:Putative cellulose-binding family ii protein n=1 Tax=Pseudallescheria apiosperma TaxID=563466 RepID=A0A084G7G0_PSEDA|nr:putative cellulose-binding family ii protein [Scedosporium apiospermum]KEZ43272.1 putative cellulose-binding family ii protein [Scedosporium apiospermum]
MLGVFGIAVLTTLLRGALAQQPLRCMPFGDSITDYGCWRPWLAEKLKEDGYTLDFVGSRQAQATCDDLDYDRDHEGHPGFQAVDIVKDKQLVGWLKDNPADIITMHLGTVDIVRSGTKADVILEAYSALVDQMRDSNPEIRIIVAQMIPYPANDGLVQELNAAIPEWAASKNSTESPIWVVDQYTGFSGTTDLYDGLHPSESGDVKISGKFHPVIIQAIESIRGSGLEAEE